MENERKGVRERGGNDGRERWKIREREGNLWGNFMV